MFNKEIYVSRREQLKKSLNGGVVLLLGNTYTPMNYPANTYQFRQDSSFVYFFGLNQANLAGIIDVDNNNEILFGDNVDIEDIIWMGNLPTINENAEKVGVKSTQPYNKLQDFINMAISKKQKIHFIPPYRAENKIILSDLLNISLKNLKENSSIYLIKAIVSIREIKSKEEIIHIDSIMDIAYEMHTTAMKMAIAGRYEREIAGKIEGIALSYGGSVSFPVIVSKSGEILHNHYHGNKLSNNDLLLCDAGFESEMYYATDHTRTIPVGGKFSQKQSDIYQIVLDANNKTTEITKPGITYQSIHLLAAKVITQGLKDLGLMKGNVDDAVKAGAHAMFFPHGLGHMMGLDVHDMEDLGESLVGYDCEINRIDQFGTAYLRLAKKLKTGFVITNEPGIYFIPALIDKWKTEKINKDFINFDKVEEYKSFGGIRLEDDLLITEDSCRILGKKRIPITPSELEEIVGKG